MKSKRLLARFTYSHKAYTLIELLVVIGLLGILTAVAIPSILKFMNKGEEEARLTEKDNVQLVVLAMLTDAKEDKLDNDYDEVETLTQIQGVTVTTPDGTYSLDNYLHLLGEPKQFIQAYDIAQDGTVTVD